MSEFAGATKNENGNWRWEGLIHADDLNATEQAWKKAVKTGNTYQIEHRIQMKNGAYRWFLSRAHAHKDEDANIIKWFGSATDIHASKTQATMLEEEVKKRTKELNEFLCTKRKVRRNLYEQSNIIEFSERLKSSKHAWRNSNGERKVKLG